MYALLNSKIFLFYFKKWKGEHFSFRCKGVNMSDWCQTDVQISNKDHSENSKIFHNFFSWK